MSEALRKPVPEFEARRSDALAALQRPPLPAQHNDNEGEAPWRGGERRAFEIPTGIWVAMVACYVVFLTALLAATGSAAATFMIAISAFYVAMFFGTARTMLGQAPPQARSPLTRAGGSLATLYGPLGRPEVMAQMLVVPGAIALFGVSVLLIRLWVA